MTRLVRLYPRPWRDRYEAERTLLQGYRVIPLFHLPAAYQVAPRVKGFPQGGFERWRTSVPA